LVSIIGLTGILFFPSSQTQIIIFTAILATNILLSIITVYINAKAKKSVEQDVNSLIQAINNGFNTSTVFKTSLFTQSVKNELKQIEESFNYLNLVAENIENLTEIKSTVKSTNKIIAVIDQLIQKLKTNDNDIAQLKREIDTRMKLVDEMCIVSEVDLKGYITYVNDKHCEVS